MKKLNLIRKTMALFLTAVMLMACMPAVAENDTETGLIEVTSGTEAGEAGTLTGTEPGDVGMTAGAEVGADDPAVGMELIDDDTATGSESGMLVAAAGSESEAAETLTGTEPDAAEVQTETQTVVVNAASDDLAVTVGAIRVVEVTPANGETVGLEVRANEHEADAKVEEGIVVRGESASGETANGSRGIQIIGDGDGSKMEVSVGEEGLSVADSQTATGIGIDINDRASNSAEVLINGPVEVIAGKEDVSVADSQTATGVSINIINNQDYNEAEVKIDGPVDVTAGTGSSEEGNAVGLSIDLGGSSNTEVRTEISGDLDVAGATHVTAVSFGAGQSPIEGNKAIVSVGENISATALNDGEGDGYNAVAVQAEGISGEETVTAHDSINAKALTNAAAVTVWTGDEDDRIEITAVGDINTTAGKKAEGIDADLNDGKLTVKAGGSISAAATDDGESAAVDLTLEGAKAEIHVGREVKAQAERTADAVKADIRNDGSLTVDVDGSVTAATTGEQRSEGAGMIVQMHGGTLNAEIDGDVTADRMGISVRDYGNGEENQSDPPMGKASIDVHGDISVNARGGSTDTEALNLYNFNENGVMEASVDGNISITGDENVEAVGVSASGGVIKVKTGGDVSATAKGAGATGLSAGACEDGEVDVELDGGISAKAESKMKGYDDAVGLNAWADGADSKVTITVGKGISAESKYEDESATAIRVANLVKDKASGVVEITVEGDVKSSGRAIAVYGDRFADQRDAETLEGTAGVREDEYLRTEYRYAEDHSGTEEYKVYYNAEGDYYYNENGTMWREAEADSGLTKIEVKGDVTGDDVGLYVNAQAQTDVIIDGTLEGGNHAVVIADESIEDNLMLTMWEIKPNEDGSVAELGRMDVSGELETTESDAVEQRIQYIIRLEQPEAGATLSTNGTFDYEGYTVAHESDNVVLKVNLESGYEIVDAFNGTDTKVSLLKNEEGEYYLVVPRGGGVLLSVELRKVEEKKDVPGDGNSLEESNLIVRVERQTELPGQTWTVVKTETAGQTETSGQAIWQGSAKNSDEPAKETTPENGTVVVTVDPNGGMLQGSTEPVVRNAVRGAEFTLPETPEKGREIFLGWYCTEYPRTDARWAAPAEGSSELLQAGSRVKISSACFFTAIWKKAE